MAKSLKSKTSKVKLKAPEGIATCNNDKAMPLFSFAFTTETKNYNFNYFNNDFRKELDVRQNLDRLLKEISSNTWVSLSSRSRYQLGGFETLSFDQVSCSPHNLTLAKDENIFSFRFGPADSYRLLGCRKHGCQVLYIIGYDFNHSAYDHGS